VLERFHQFDYVRRWHANASAHHEILDDRGAVGVMINPGWAAGGQEIDDERLGRVPHRGKIGRDSNDVFGWQLNLVGTVH